MYFFFIPAFHNNIYRIYFCLLIDNFTRKFAFINDTWFPLVAKMSYPCCSIKPHMISKCYALLLYRRQLLYFLTLSNCRLLYNFLAPHSASAITKSTWNKLNLYQIISLILCWTLSFSKSVTKNSSVILILLG